MNRNILQVGIYIVSLVTLLLCLVCGPAAAGSLDPRAPETLEGGQDRIWTVAVAPCIRGSDVPEDLAASASDALVTGLSAIPQVRVLDRSRTDEVLREQDLALLSHASVVVSGRFGDMAAERVVLSRLTKLQADWFVTIQLVDVASQEVLRGRIASTRQERELVQLCAACAVECWHAVEARTSPPEAVDPRLATLFGEIDTLEARRLLGRQAQRAESVYRRYRSAARAGDAAEAERLCVVAEHYLLDSVCLLQRVLDPPAGMVYVPPGSTVLPTTDGTPKRFELDGFFIDRTEYTRADFARFLAAVKRGPLPGWQPPIEATANLAVTGVDWYDAQAVAEWRGLRLPTHLQWLRAARGAKSQRYPWGDDWNDERCDHVRHGRSARPTPVGSHLPGASPYGVLDAVGGVFEWLDTWHAPKYWLHAPRRNPPGPSAGAGKLIAGGSYRSGPEGCTCESVEAVGPRGRRDDLGFRCVLPLTDTSPDRGKRYP